MKDNSSKRRYYLNKKGQNSLYASPYNMEEKKYKDLKNIEKVDNNKRYFAFKSENLDTLKNPKNIITNITVLNVVKEDISLNPKNKRKKNNYLQHSNDNIYKSNDNNKVNKYLENKNNLIKTNNIINNNNKSYFNYIQNKPGYKTVFENSYNSPKLLKNDQNNYIEENYKKQNKNKIININNYDYNKIFTNKSYNISKDINNNNTVNYKGKKQNPVIPIIDKKWHYRFTTHNNYNEKKSIIKIQSVWRGYLLRKLTVGSIKKYIGFVTLIKYVEKLNNNNKKNIFKEVIDILKNYINNKHLKYKFRRINGGTYSNQNYSDNYREKKNNEMNTNYNKNNRRYRNFNIVKKENNTDKVLFKNNYYFNNVEFDSLKNSPNNSKRSSENDNKTGVIIYFVNKDKEKERE